MISGDVAAQGVSGRAMLLTVLAHVAGRVHVLRLYVLEKRAAVARGIVAIQTAPKDPDCVSLPRHSCLHKG